MSRPARAAAEAYCAAVNAGDLEGLRRLFSEDVTALNTVGEYKGRVEVLGFYEQLILASKVKVQASHTYEAGDTCIVELEGRSPDSPELFRMVDIFTVDADGQVKRLAIYRR